MGLLGEQFGGLFGVWETLLEVSGGGLGEALAVLQGILGVLLPKKPSIIPEGVPKSSPGWAQEAPRGPRRSPKRSQETCIEVPEAIKTSLKETLKLK